MLQYYLMDIADGALTVTVNTVAEIVSIGVPEIVPVGDENDNPYGNAGLTENTGAPVTSTISTIRTGVNDVAATVAVNAVTGTSTVKSIRG